MKKQYRIWHLVNGEQVAFEMPADSWQEAQQKFLVAYRDMGRPIPNVVRIEEYQGIKWITVWSKI